MSKLFGCILAVLGIAVLVGVISVYSWMLSALGTPPSINWDNAAADSAAIEYYKLLQSFIEAAVVGVAVGLAAVIIPAVISSRREAFERHKESRQAYSEASTGVLYLPERLAGLEYNDTLALINHVHEKKHIAETYDELKAQLSRRRGNKTADQWSTNMYKTLNAITQIVRDKANSWNNLNRAEKLSLLKNSIETLRSEDPDYYT